MLHVDVMATRCPNRFWWRGHELALGEVLASGRFGSIRAVSVHQSAQTLSPLMGESLVAKVVEHADSGDEASILELCCKHPNVVSLFGSVNLNSLYKILLLERCHGELFDYITRLSGCLDERSAAHWMHELLSAVDHCHSYGIVHRDIKPENLLLFNATAHAPLKLADFGSAKRVGQAQIINSHTPCGSLGYTAPEMASSLTGRREGGESYGPAADLWSCGVVAYVLLTGCMPTFSSPAPHDRSAPVALNLPAALMQGISENALDFVRDLLQPQRLRPTAGEARTHAWLAGAVPACHGLDWRPGGPGLEDAVEVSDAVSSGLHVASDELTPPGGGEFPKHVLLTPRRLRETAPLPPLLFLDEESAVAETAADSSLEPIPNPLNKSTVESAACASPKQQPTVDWKREEAPAITPMRRRALSVATGLDTLGALKGVDSASRRKRSLDAGATHVSKTPSTLFVQVQASASKHIPRSNTEDSPSSTSSESPPSAPDAPDAVCTSEAAAAADDRSMPRMKRACSISSCLKDLQFQ